MCYILYKKICIAGCSPHKDRLYLNYGSQPTPYCIRIPVLTIPYTSLAALQNPFRIFAPMIRNSKHITPCAPAPVVLWDLRDCFTESFPEFVPFCSRLYYFSNFKDFSTVVPA